MFEYFEDRLTRFKRLMKFFIELYPKTGDIATKIIL